MYRLTRRRLHGAIEVARKESRNTTDVKKRRTAQSERGSKTGRGRGNEELITNRCDRGENRSLDDAMRPEWRDGRSTVAE